MRFAALCVVVVCLTSAAFAQMTPGVTVTSGERFPFVADFNGDGLDDLFNARSVVLNNGTSFSEAHDLGLPPYETIFGVLDVNGDGIPDLITYNGPLENKYRLYIADASRHYGKPIVVSTSVRPYTGDLDGDGKDDLVFIVPVRDGFREIANDMNILRTRGDGTFEPLASYRLPPGPQIDQARFFRLLMGDLDRDGIPDIVIRCADVADGNLVVMRGLGGGKYTVEARYMPNDHLNWGSWSTRLSDMDGDGNLDVIIVGFRTIHVLFGDGRGNFPRSATAKVAQVRGITGAGWSPMDLNKVDQPRDLAVGHFTRSDRMEIAADTMEGDVVFFAYEQGGLKETSRIDSGLFSIDILPGNFRGSGLTDLCVYTTSDQSEATPPPQIFYGNVDAAAVIAPRIPMRRRAAGAPSTPHETVLRLQTHADCLADTSQEFAFKRDGVFGHAANGDALFDPDTGTIYLRVPMPELTLGPLEAALTRDSSGGYSATLAVGGPEGSPCHGDPLHYMSVTATVEH